MAAMAAAPADHDPGLTLCLSGGGFRATLFHLGALGRLNELGILSAVRVVTSVSGGSILSGILAARWASLTLDANGVFRDFAQVAEPARLFCAFDLRTRLLAAARFHPRYLLDQIRDLGAMPAAALGHAYEAVMGTTRLADLPAPGPSAPRFIFCATSVQTGACWHFHGGPGGRMGDFYTGYYDTGDVTVSQAVAASSAFPPGFGALRLRPPAGSVPDRIDPWGVERPRPRKRRDIAPGGYRLLLLTDGGVYDNLGLEPVWDRSRSLLVSDAGHPFSSAPTVSQWLGTRLVRAADISAEQTGAVRKRWLVERARARRSRGGPAAGGTLALWAINTPPGRPDPLRPPCYGAEARARLAAVRTDLNAFTPGEAGCLENLGYWLADAAIRRRAPERILRNAPFAWPSAGWVDDTRALHALASSADRYLLRDLWRYLLMPGRY